MAKASDLRNENRKAVRKCFYRKGSWSLREVIDRTGLSHGSVISVFKEMEENREIILYEKSGSSVGRKTYRYILNPEYRHFLCLSVRRTGERFSLLLDRVNLDGEVQDSMQMEDCEQFTEEDLRTMLGRFLEKYPDTDMILLSAPGICENGVVTNGTRPRVDAGKIIREFTGVPSVVENDVNVACIGFHQDRRKKKTIALVYQAANTVFGCGILINKRLYNGFSHAAGELRYFPFMDHAETKDPGDLLKEQILSVAAVLNPEVIGYCSDVVRHELDFHGSRLPQEHMPEMIYLDDLESYVIRGLYSMGIDHLVRQSGGIE